MQVKPGKPHAVKALGRNLVLWRDGAGKRALPGRLLSASRRAAVARRDRREQHLLPLSRRDARWFGHHRARAGHAGLRARGPQGGRQLRGASKPTTASSSTSRARSGRSPANCSCRTEFSDPEWSSILCMGRWACSYRFVYDNFADPMHACYLHADSLHARVRRQAGRDADRKARRWLLHRARRTEGREPGLDPRRRRRHAGLLPARHSLSRRRRARRAVPHHRLHHAGRRGVLPGVLLALPAGDRHRARSPGAFSIAPPWRRGIGTCWSRTARC